MATAQLFDSCSRQTIGKLRRFRLQGFTTVEDKALLILTVLCITLTLCHGSCFWDEPQAVIKDGKVLDPDSCTDPYDGSKHALGSAWNTAKCFGCSCSSKGVLHCCTRYGGPAVMEGCKGVVDLETCTYKFYKVDDPSTPCPRV
uniref:small serum protein 5-like n=1 Tax=Euleptes europaea TaxID=460621 RepID=UPI00253F85C3|nr:small serum protein 5-like [Euleptes europaea]